MKSFPIFISCVTVAVFLYAVINGPARASAPAGRYTISDGVVNDKKTRLAWQRNAAPNALTWDEAESYCKTLDLAGGGWRLPSIKELHTLVDETRWDPAIDDSAFPGTPSDSFWAWPKEPNGAAPICYFGQGMSTMIAATTPAYVRCVR
ncbi:MAG: DUF1566 domain-containing protein [Deltaproteobacteria bacterium]|nr:DUF1566 domain-containing protein [Deltaproteobacteria bacterium]